MGFRVEVAKYGFRRHVSVSRYKPGADISSRRDFPNKPGADISSRRDFPNKPGADISSRRDFPNALSLPRQFQECSHMHARKPLPKTGRAKIRFVAKTRLVAKTLPEDKSGEDTPRREDTGAGEDISRRQVWRRYVSSRRHASSQRYFPKTAQAKTRIVANIFPEDRSGEDARRREDTWAGNDTSRRQVGRRYASSRRHVGGEEVPEDGSGAGICKLPQPCLRATPSQNPTQVFARARALKPSVSTLQVASGTCRHKPDTRGGT